MCVQIPEHEVTDYIIIIIIVIVIRCDTNGFNRMIKNTRTSEKQLLARFIYAFNPSKYIILRLEMCVCVWYNFYKTR